MITSIGHVAFRITNLERSLVLQRDFGKSFMSHLTFAMAA